MYEHLLDAAIWMQHHRWFIIKISNLMVAGAMLCLLAYGMTTEILSGRQADGSIPWSVIENTEKLQSHEQRLQRLDLQSASQQGLITSLEITVAEVKVKVESLAERQSESNKLLYGILGAICVNSLLSYFGKAKSQEYRDPEPAYRNRSRWK